MRANIFHPVARHFGCPEVALDIPHQLHHGTLGVDGLHCALDDGILVVGRDEVGKRIAFHLLYAQRNALSFHVDCQYHGLDLVAFLVVAHRLFARGARAHLMADIALDNLDKLIANVASGDKAYANPTEIPKGEYRGVGFHEAPRGTLSHWIVIKNKKIENYQAVVPSTWNAAPKNDKGEHGPYEASLIGNPIADTTKPLEVLRTIHSFDPCIACAVHTIDPEGKEITKVKVL